MTKQQPATDYLAASLDEEAKGALPLTPNSTSADAAGLVEVLKLITDPAAHQKQLAERQGVQRERADLARGWLELRKAKAAQAEELAKIRAAFDDAMAADKANQQAENARAKAALLAKVEEWQRLLASAPWQQEVSDAV